MQTAEIRKDGSILLGAPPEERAWGLLGADSLPLTSLLTEGHEKLTTAQRDLLRRGMVADALSLCDSKPFRSATTRYLDLLNSGTQRLNAAQQAFGNLANLQHDLTQYKHQRSLMGISVGAEHTQPGAIEVEPLSPGAAAVILLRART